MDVTVKVHRAVKRWSSAIVVFGSTAAVLASPLAIGTASAAAATMAFDAGQGAQTVAAGATTTITGTATGFSAAPTVHYAVTAGPDSGASGACTVPTATTFSCSVANTHASNAAAGTSDSVQITGTNAGDTANSLTASISFTSTPAIAKATEVDLSHVTQSGNTATVTGTYLPKPAAGQSAPQIEYSVLGGPDVVAGGAGTLCSTLLTGAFSCTVTSSNPTAADTVEVFADNDNDKTISVGDVGTTAYVFGTASAAGLSPTSTTVPTGNCAPFTASVSDSAGHPLAGQTLDITVTETTSANPGANAISVYNSSCAAPATGGTVVANSGGTFTTTFTTPVTTGPNGTVKFDVSATKQGTGTIVAKSATSGLVTSATQSITWTAGGADAVTGLAVNPTTYTGYVNSTPTFTVTATDASGHGVQNVQVWEEVSSGGDTLGATSCTGTTNSNGAIVCDELTNANHVTTDTLTFWVNNNSAGAHTAGPDSGEPQTTATATFQAQPAVVAAKSGLTCVDQHVGANHNKAASTCTVPTTDTSVTFTATIKDANGAPLSGVVVDFAATSATIGGNSVTGASLPSGSGTTDASGHATFVVSDANPKHGDTVTVADKVGAATLQTAKASWETPAAFALALDPTLQSVTKGGTVSVTAQVTDQFGDGVSGAKTITYSVSGRNNGTPGLKTTDATGAAVLSYPDLAPNSSSATDTITATDLTDGFPSVTATVKFVNGPSTASSVTLDASGHGTSDGTCAIAGHNAATNVALTATTEVCAVVKNSDGELLAGAPVAVTVGTGAVDGHGALSSSSDGSVTVKTDFAGVAYFDVTSTKSGVQTISATSGTATASSSVTYAAPAPALARNIAVTPTPAKVASGTQQKFTAAVTDAYGNSVPNVSVLFTQSGPGNIGGSSSATLTTGPDGTASVTLSTVSPESGSGSVVGSIAAGSAASQCGAAANAGTPAAAKAGNCTSTATYTVGQQAASVTLQAVGPHRIGKQELIAATVTNSDGSAAANETVYFTITGANVASGSGATTAKGVAFIAYTPARAGTDQITAYVDTNGNAAKDAGEPTGTLQLKVVKGAKEKPTIHLTSHHYKVTIHVVSHPKLAHAKVTYYIERLGRFHRIGTNHTGARGKAHKTFREKVHVQHTFRVKVTGKAGVKTGTSHAKSIRTKK